MFLLACKAKEAPQVPPPRPLDAAIEPGRAAERAAVVIPETRAGQKIWSRDR